MNEQIKNIDDETQRLINAWSELTLADREEILYFVQHPEELQNLIRFDQILIY